MPKDPAFLFYPADASEDTQFMNRLERGAYFDILKAQKRFGKFSIETLRKVLGNDFESCWPALKPCLKEIDGFYFIEWVAEKIEERKRFSESRSKNRKKKTSEEDMNNISNTSEEDMVIEDENVIVIKDKKEIKKEKPIKILFKDSEYFDIQVLTGKLSSCKEPYCNAHVGYYYEAMELWSRQNNEKKVDWFATCQNWILKDITNNNFKDKNYKPSKSNGKQTFNYDTEREKLLKELAGNS